MRPTFIKMCNKHLSKPCANNIKFRVYFINLNLKKINCKVNSAYSNGLETNLSGQALAQHAPVLGLSFQYSFFFLAKFANIFNYNEKLLQLPILLIIEYFCFVYKRNFQQIKYILHLNVVLLNFKKSKWLPLLLVLLYRQCDLAVESRVA